MSDDTEYARVWRGFQCWYVDIRRGVRCGGAPFTWRPFRTHAEALAWAIERTGQ